MVGGPGQEDGEGWMPIHRCDSRSVRKRSQSAPVALKLTRSRMQWDPPVSAEIEKEEREETSVGGCPPGISGI